MREKVVETALVSAVRELGGLPIKLVSPSMAGLPDRLILLPGARASFIELKAPGRKMRPLQVRRASQITALGFPVVCIDHPDQIRPVLEQLRVWQTGDPIPVGVRWQI